MSCSSRSSNSDNAAIVASALTSLTGLPVITQPDYLNQIVNGNDNVIYQHVNLISLHNSYLASGAVGSRPGVDVVGQPTVSTISQQNDYSQQQYIYGFSDSQTISYPSSFSVQYFPLSITNPNNSLHPQETSDNPQQIQSQISHSHSQIQFQSSQQISHHQQTQSQISQQISHYQQIQSQISQQISYPQQIQSQISQQISHPQQIQSQISQRISHPQQIQSQISQQISHPQQIQSQISQQISHPQQIQSQISQRISHPQQIQSQISQQISHPQQIQSQISQRISHPQQIQSQISQQISHPQQIQSQISQQISHPQQIQSQISQQNSKQKLVTITINISTLNGQKIPINNIPIISKISAIKFHIESKTRIPSNLQRLIYSGILLKDNLTLLDYNILNNNSTISLIGQNNDVISFLDSNFLDPIYDCDFTNVKDDKTFMRGTYEYRRPCGWKRIAIKVLNKYGPDNNWLGKVANKGSWRYESDPMEWPVSYHGTDKFNAKSIAETGFDITKGKRFKFGYGIYSTPDINIAALYATKFTHNNEVYCLVFQNRVNPNTLNKICTNIGEYWISPRSDDIRPYGICIKKLGKFQP